MRRYVPVNLMAGGTRGLQTASIVCGLPILLIQILMCLGLIRWFKNQKDFDLVSRVTVDGEPCLRTVEK